MINKQILLLAFALSSLTTTMVYAGGKPKITYSDDRTRVEAGEQLWLGRLYKPNRARCSAVLISPEYILSAGHCVDDNPSGEYVFKMQDGKKISNARVVDYRVDYGRGLYKKVPKNFDWAILKLSSKIKIDIYPELVDLRYYSKEMASKKIRYDFAGFPGDKNDGGAYIHKSCKTLSKKIKKNGFVGTWCDNYSGMSGGPVLIAGTNKLVGIVSWMQSGFVIAQNTANFYSIHSIIDDIKRIMSADQVEE